MEILYQFQENLLRQVSDSFFRSLFNKMNWGQRMLAIKGPRGAGKSTMLLQYLKYRLNDERDKALNLLGAAGKGVALLQKPEKVFLENTNLSY
jgi:predicted AAA+ superfamily ATPase